MGSNAFENADGQHTTHTHTTEGSGQVLPGKRFTVHEYTFQDYLCKLGLSYCMELGYSLRILNHWIRVEFASTCKHTHRHT